jgi:cyclophilin family peptidyl-prolyl cis-trans isomerase
MHSINRSLRSTLIAATILIGSFAVTATSIAQTVNPKVSLKTNQGEIIIELYPEAAPKTVANFLSYVKAGHYTGIIFHRVIDGFMIQTGGYDKNLNEKPKKNGIPLEAGLALAKGLKNDLGTVAMARTNDPNSAAAQFFINVKNNDFLNHQALPDGDPVEITMGGRVMTLPRAQAKQMTAGYTPFGKVISGMEVVDKIKAVETKAKDEIFQNLPVKPVIIESAKILK